MAELETTVNETTVDTTNGSEVSTGVETNESAEIARLKSELAKQKTALDKATKEAADNKRALRAKQSAEEAAAEEAKTLQQSMMEELEQLRKEKAVAAATAKVVSFVGDNEASARVAEYLYGAEDVDAALAEIQKAWTAKEKALRLEYGKIPAPGVGSSEGVTVTKAQLDAMGYMDRLKFATEHPDEYNKLMGR